MIRRVRFRWVRAAAGVVVIDLATRLGLIAAAAAMAFGADDATFPLGHDPVLDRGRPERGAAGGRRDARRPRGRTGVTRRPAPRRGAGQPPVSAGAAAA
ncbi:hypothetical protein [Actinomadura sp. 3N508]|uniref:hypothetical protein n=1 Tax=Actinomadura sp. 3N508 TaxID=3375153 RepID=UPI0037B15CFF